MPTVNDIMYQLNEANTEPMGFPHFGVFFPVDSRLSAYCDGSTWALVIETMVFDDGPEEHTCIATHVYCYGSDLPEGRGIAYPYLNVTSDGPSGPLFDPDDIMGHRIREGATDMQVRNEVIPITTDRKVYEAAGVLMKRSSSFAPQKKNAGRKVSMGIHGVELLRLIVPKHRKVFFATEAEITKRIGLRMPLLIRLDEWYHSDQETGEEPYDSESYQLIAACIAKSDPSLYKPKVPPNTHWKNWPQAGFL